MRRVMLSAALAVLRPRGLWRFRCGTDVSLRPHSHLNVPDHGSGRQLVREVLRRAADHGGSGPADVRQHAVHVPQESGREAERRKRHRSRGLLGRGPGREDEGIRGRGRQDRHAAARDVPGSSSSRSSKTPGARALKWCRIRNCSACTTSICVDRTRRRFSPGCWRSSADSAPSSKGRSTPSSTARLVSAICGFWCRRVTRSPAKGTPSTTSAGAPRALWQ